MFSVTRRVSDLSAPPHQHIRRSKPSADHDRSWRTLDILLRSTCRRTFYRWCSYPCRRVFRLLRCWRHALVRRRSRCGLALKSPKNVGDSYSSENNFFIDSISTAKADHTRFLISSGVGRDRRSFEHIRNMAITCICYPGPGFFAG